MSDAQVCTVDDGLINPAAMPAKSADLDTTKITGAADDLRTMGTTVDTTADEIKSIWGGLGACYQAPEQAEVYALMDRPATASEKVKTTFASMAGHLDTTPVSWRSSRRRWPTSRSAPRRSATR